MSRKKKPKTDPTDPPPEDSSSGQHPDNANPGNQSIGAAGEEGVQEQHPDETSKPETCREYLRCPFGPEERESLANKMSRDIMALTTIKEEKATANAQFKSRITSLEGEIAGAARMLSVGYEMCYVDCLLIRDYERKVVLITRADTFELVRERKMTIDEMQRSLLAPEPMIEVPRQTSPRENQPTPEEPAPPPLPDTDGFEQDCSAGGEGQPDGPVVAAEFGI